MNVKQCDRCGAVFAPVKQEGGYVLGWKEEHNPAILYDLCPACESKLHDWLHSVRNELPREEAR